MNEIINNRAMIALSGLEVKRFFENHPKYYKKSPLTMEIFFKALDQKSGSKRRDRACSFLDYTATPASSSGADTTGASLIGARDAPDGRVTSRTYGRSAM